MRRKVILMFSNMQKKEKIYIGIIAGLVVIIAGLLIAFFTTKNNKTKVNNNTSTDAGIIYSTDKNIEQTSQQEDKNAGVQSEDCGAEAKFFISNSWESQGRKYAQVDITVSNTGDEKIDDWNLKLAVDDVTKVEQNWNCDIKEESDSNKWLSLAPVQYNQVIEVNGSTQGIGMIISTDDLKDIDRYELSTSRSGVNKTYRTGGVSSADTQEQPDNDTDNTNNNSSNSGGSESSQPDNGQVSSGDSSSGGGSYSDYSGSYTNSAAGRLHISGTHIVDEAGNYVQLRGVSTHGLAWYPQYVNEDAFKTLRDEWNVNVIRLAMYTEEYGGYCAGGDRTALKELIDKGVRYASDLGMYVIIDWHILSDSNPNQNKDEAVSFFSEMAQRYAGYGNVIYEICNEPQNSDWNSVIKPYAEDVIRSIRQYDGSGIIIVGTNTWSQDVDAVIGNEIDDDNVMYALHFYAGTHKDWIRNKLTAALDEGVPVIVSECSICDASGNGGIDYSSAEEWMSILNSRGVSVIAWSLSNKNETSALISSGCDKLSGWSDDELSDTGRWFKEAFRS